MASAVIYTDGSYLEKNPTWHTEDSFWKSAAVAGIVTRNNISPATIADIGCGAGEVLRQVVEKLPGAKGVGFEVSPDAFALCQRLQSNMLSFRNDDLFETTDRYNLLMAIDVFEHVEDYIGFLRKLRPHADAFVFHIPLDVSVQSVFRIAPILELRKRVGHLHYFTRDTAIATLEYAGFTLVDSCYTEIPDNARSTTTLKNRLMRLPRRLASTISPDLAARVLGGRSLLALCR